MAILDPRIFELIETLTAARMDWLAFELVEGIQAGRAPTETPETLAMTRRTVREDGQPKAIGKPKLVSKETIWMEGDNQIEWASQYVAERLDATLAYLTQAIENLETIAGDDAKNAAPMSSDAGAPIVVFADGEVQREAGRVEVDAAIAALPQLRSSLEAWSAQVRGQAPT